MTGDAIEALSAGDVERALALLPADDELTVFEAAAFGRLQRLEELLRADPSRAAEVSGDGFTALHLAVFGGQEEAARLLIEHGADVDALATSEIARVAPLGTAAFVRSAPLAALLLDAGADVNRRAPAGSPTSTVMRSRTTRSSSGSCWRGAPTLWSRPRMAGGRGISPGPRPCCAFCRVVSRGRATLRLRRR